INAPSLGTTRAPEPQSARRIPALLLPSACPWWSGVLVVPLPRRTRLPVLPDGVADRLVAVLVLEMLLDRRREDFVVELTAHPVDDLALEKRVGLQLTAEGAVGLVALLLSLPDLPLSASVVLVRLARA